MSAEASPIERYAREHGLDYARAGTVPEATPLLSRGDRRFATDLAVGELPGGLEGTVARYTYVDDDERGDQRVQRYTVLSTLVPESVGFVPLLLCRHRRTARGLDDEADPDYPKRRSLELESAVVRQRYRIEISDEQDPQWMRELFSPSFVAWLAERAPEGMSFELVDGALCVSLPGHDEDPASVERLVAAAAHVAGRLRREAYEEESGSGIAHTAAADERAARLRSKLAKVEWPEPPRDARRASRAYLRVAAHEFRPWAGALIMSALVFVGVYRELVGESGRVAVAAGTAILAFAMTAIALVWRSATRYGSEAFVREYARSRGFRLQDGRRFHAEHVRLPLPGVAEHAMSGPPGQGELLLLSDRSNRRRRKYYNLLLTKASSAGGAPAESRVGSYHVALHGDELVVFRRSQPPSRRSARQLDRFSEEAGRIAAEMGGRSEPRS